MATVAFSIPGFRYTAEAGADLSGDQFLGMIHAADGQIDPAGNGLAIDGVLQNKPSAVGQAAELVQSGITKVLAGIGGITAGDRVSMEAGGAFVASATGDVVVGRCLVSAGAGEIGSVLLFGGSERLI